ncbi:competence protein ComE [Alkalihalobacillus alcalophilus ATCC 27647 = CGMCC 1.3604]|uniref:ComE operon protein 2 n=1 Tax=Alkalihalobacillus alcalophilus ATCC 27647 = CGMCC 1.3604 TaxID=1218173 RepID=A0A094XI53_ALKAL|nr:ComE operon protein 2 [Alkalihalobacillus alcalophilus]KGA98465.1 competence protein ComE [Alkalihalobacillus alcalophilus ATCC 27647 = CGMCC 1.3604]MED1563347.1 ComE operon protein 2 [Alkalihalobacillus alcalophilus]THG88534.1 competence protein ComE [Alkalihalobacillus alcalophilus ATCC 27647 = CGMCC 1.3604]
MERISWNQYFMAQSQLLSLRSTCTRLMVGATIVRDKRIIAGGYNGSVSGSDHCIDKGCYVVDNHCIRTIHAEVNALLQCAKFGVPTEGAEIYVTHFPCVHCSKAVIQAGIKKVYYDADYKNHPYALELFEQAGIEVEQVELDEVVLDRRYQDKLQLTTDLLHKLEETDIDKEELMKLIDQTRTLYSPTKS